MVCMFRLFSTFLRGIFACLRPGSFPTATVTSSIMLLVYGLNGRSDTPNGYRFLGQEQERSRDLCCVPTFHAQSPGMPARVYIGIHTGFLLSAVG